MPGTKKPMRMMRGGAKKMMRGGAAKKMMRGGSMMKPVMAKKGKAVRKKQ